MSKYYARIRKWGVLPTNRNSIIGHYLSLPDLWNYVEVNMLHYLPKFMIPNCPKNFTDLPLVVRHIKSDNEVYPLHKDTHTGLVMGLLFVPQSAWYREQGGVYVLEVWTDDYDVAIPEEYWEDHEILS